KHIVLNLNSKLLIPSKIPTKKVQLCSQNQETTISQNQQIPAP
ncbi:21416_t:CDS:1, partial [Cetraspora pellucida]